MPRITVNADMFRAAYSCVSSEETRYYLNGVYVHPREGGGVFMVSTDGHRLIVVLDDKGHADRPAIIRLGKAALAACKTAKREDRRTLIVDMNGPHEKDGTTATVTAYTSKDDLQGTRMAVEDRVEIDGTFPDYRRVIPSITTPLATVPAYYNGAYLGDLAAAGGVLKSIGEPRPQSAPMSISTADVNGPALVKWAGVPNAFAVVMPIRATDDASPELPSWYVHPATKL